ncbi:MAG TPA: helix-turn-helix transcriptional regulator [Solirubrobacterales bacterium]|nr:helix-turn-helix transcriptional regulator [Solirubrobacterales bacterium]
MDGKRKRFAVNLTRARQASGISQEELGFRAGLHRTEVSLLERGGREPRLGTLVKLAISLGTSVEALCEGIQWSSKRGDFKIDPPRRRR